MSRAGERTWATASAPEGPHLRDLHEVWKSWRKGVRWETQHRANPGRQASQATLSSWFLSCVLREFTEDFMLGLTAWMGMEKWVNVDTEDKTDSTCWQDEERIGGEGQVRGDSLVFRMKMSFPAAETNKDWVWKQNIDFKAKWRCSWGTWKSSSWFGKEIV